MVQKQKAHTNNLRPLIGITLFILIIGSVVLAHEHRVHNQVTLNSNGTFSGTVTADGCAQDTPGSPPIGDVGCTITVGNKEIQVIHGNALVKSWGQVYGFQTNQDITGRKVTVKADGSGTSYALSSDDDYVKLAD